MADYSTKDIKVNIDDKGIAVISLERKPGNAFNRPFYMSLGSIVESVSADSRTKVIIVKSGLKYFTVGLDLKDFSSTLEKTDGVDDVGRKALVFRGIIKEWQDKFTALDHSIKPIITAVHGHCLGAGVDLLAASDINVADQDSTFSIREVKVGLAADIGSLNKLTKKLGATSALYELALTGRDFTAQEAKELGLISTVTQGGAESVFERAYSLAKEIAENSPIAVAGTKHLINYSKDHSTQDSLDYTAVWNSAMLQSEDLTNAAIAAISKEKANFDYLPKL